MTVVLLGADTVIEEHYHCDKENVSGTFLRPSSGKQVKTIQTAYLIPKNR